MRKLSDPIAKAPSSSALSEEDSLLFRTAVGKVRPVISDRVQPAASKPARRRQQEADWPDFGPAEIPLLATGDIMSFTAPGLQKRVLRRLRAGGFGMDDELDLHGATVDEAKRRLADFLRRTIADGCRCVHVIHGKGYRSEGGYPILKNRINLWLRHHPEVLAFCTAKPADGGAGAIYVLLRDGSKAREFPYP